MKVAPDRAKDKTSAAPSRPAENTVTISATVTHYAADTGSLLLSAAVAICVEGTHASAAE